MKEWFIKEFAAANEVESMPIADIYDNEDTQYARKCQKIDIDTSLKESICAKADVGENTLFCAAFGMTLSKYCGEDAVLYTTANCTNEEDCSIAAIKERRLPVFHNLADMTSVVELLQQTRKQNEEARKNGCDSFAEICEELEIKSDIVFVYDENETLRYENENEGVKFLFVISKNKGEYNICLDYQENKYSQDFIDAFCDTYEHILNELCKKETLAEVTCCNEKMVALLDGFNEGGRMKEEGERDGETILSLFKKVARQYPDNIAVIFKEKRYTYRELDELTDKIGSLIYNKVKDCGKKEPVVSIIIPKNEFIPILPLAAIKAGCAYQPLDPSYPQERLNFMVKDADAVLLIADNDLRGLINQYEGEVILTEELENETLRYENETLRYEDRVRPESLFILLYTSGSTGVPKGVMIEHQNIVAFTDWYREYYELKPEHNVAAYASFGFDANMMDLYPTLTTGATVHIIPEEIRLDLVALNDYFETNNITHSLITTQVGVQFMQNTDNHSLKHLSVGGEKLVSVDPPKGYTFHNAYGPTECTIISTIMPVKQREANIPIGKPTSMLKCYVMDKQMHRLPIGAAGELIIVGKQVGRGYLNRPDKTAEAFFTMDGERAYHSGDIVRYRKDGKIEFVGRRDGQVKIRGFRIELKEVETVIRDFEGIKDVTVQAFDDANGGKFIAAYIVSDDTIDIEALNDFILDQKPPYMVPAVTMQIEKIPLNVNQKVDKKALPKPERQAPTNEGTATANAPLNALEKDLKAIIASVVNTEDFGITDILGFVGLTSISGIKLATLLYKKYGVQVNAKTLAKTGTLQSIENEILMHWMEGRNENKNETLRNENRKKEGGLSFPQQGVYAECMANPGSILYNLPDLLTFPKGTTVERLKDAVANVLAAHPYMTCHFVSNDRGEVVQMPIDGFELDIPVTKMTAEAFEGHKKDITRPFDLSKGPLFRFEIFEIEDGAEKDVVLFSDIHHLIGDGASLNMIYQQICQALDGEAIEAEEYDYYQFVQDQVMDSSAEEYFDRTIGGVEEVSRLLPDIYEDSLDHHQRTISVDIPSDHIEEVCHKHGITPAAFFLAAASLTVSRYLCEEEVTMITISNGRSNLKVSDTAGMFVNTLPLALHVGTGDSVASLLQHASSVFEEAIDHETYPFARVASKYGFTPQISYACQMGVIDELATREGKVQIETLELDVAKVPMAMFINGSFETGLTLDIDYDSSLYSEVMMQHFADSVVNVAKSFISKQELKEISLTTEKEWTLLDSFNAPLFTDYDHNDTVVSLFQKHVQEHPDKMAAIYGDKRYTYRQLDEATDVLASIIYNKVCAITGKKELREEVVSIIIDRNEWVFLLPLAVLKTGCAYEPLDPSYPADRLNYMVQDAQAHLLIGQPELTGLVDEYDGEILLTTDLEDCLSTTQPYNAPALSPYRGICPKGREGLSPNDLLLMLYTSGSTGKPKGVQIEHHSLVTFAHGISKADFYTHDCVAAAYASFGFDVCMMDTFCTLLNGGTLVVIPESMRLELKMLAEYMESEHVTQIFMTTQVGVQFLQNYPSVKHLRYLGMGGEKLPAVNPEGLTYKILNGYGPTENTCGVSLFPIKHWEKNIPLGRPFPTIKGYILDKSGHRLPPGACGEYCVAGDQPARGYLGLPEKTAEVFVEYDGLRMYHTGDIVRYRENGDVEFVGRKDGMVKIRGFRIELKEVEAAIRPFEGVEDVTVQAYDYDGGGKYLAAFVVTSQETLDTEKLLAFVKEQKPPYMVPAIVMQIDHIPLTVNQKVDKKALPKPQMAAAAYVAPKNKIEEDICNIFGEVLGLEKVSAASDFFELGGSSIIALKVVIAADKKGYTVVYNDVFAYPTAQDMAEHIVQTSGAPADAPVVENTNSESTAETSVYGPGIKEISPDGFDYRPINALLRGNTMEAFMNGEQQPIGDVLLAGATGYLGIHVLKDLIDNYTGKIYCFVRGKGALTAEKRLKSLLYYYFENSFGNLFVSESNKEGRIHIIEGDATDPHALDDFSVTGITVVNCAACVKHFSKGNEIERINVGSVRNLIAWCIKSSSRLVHVSTGSVMGSSVNNVPPQGFLFNESMLYVGQLIDNNQYVSSKFMAERIIYDAILHHGLNAKVMRVGNLAPRDKDGEFQINFRTNNFMATLAAYTALGMIPYSEMDSHIEFSPIDKVARSIMLLASTPRECVCFMPSNHHRPHTGDVVMQLAELGYPIRMVENEEFQNAVQAALNDPSKVDKMRPFMVYEGSMTGSNIRVLDYDDLNVNYTIQVLYRLGFRWPTTTEDYVRRFLTAICGLNFFD